MVIGKTKKGGWGGGDPHTFEVLYLLLKSLLSSSVLDCSMWLTELDPLTWATGFTWYVQNPNQISTDEPKQNPSLLKSVMHAWV